MFSGLAVLLALSSCNEDPTTLGYSLVDDTISVYAVSSAEAPLISSSETYNIPPEFINPGNSLIGKTQYYSAAVAMRFAPIPDTLDYLNESDIIDCELRLFPGRYAIGDTAGSNTLSFDIHRIDNRWVKETSPNEFFGGSIYSPTPLQNFTGTINRSDTMRSFTMPFPKDLVIDWFKLQKNKDTIWGIALVPNENSKIINQFKGQGSGIDTLPYIRVIYKDKNSNIDTIYMNSALEKSFYKGNFISDQNLVIQGGLSYYSRLRFDLTSLPKFGGVHKAELYLTLDESKTIKGNLPLDTVITLAYFEDEADELKFATPDLYYGCKRETGKNTFVAPSISSAVSYWLRKDRKGSLALKFNSISAEATFNKFSFHGPNDPDPTKRPKLLIIYSELKLKEE